LFGFISAGSYKSATGKKTVPCVGEGGEEGDPFCLTAAVEIDEACNGSDGLTLRHACSLIGMLVERQSENPSGLADDGRKQSREESGWGGARGGRVTVEEVSELVARSRCHGNLSWTE
jgi:hypothetical protein